MQSTTPLAALRGIIREKIGNIAGLLNMLPAI